MSTIYVSAGHGGKQPGAVFGGRVEKVYTLAVANDLAALLRQAGHIVIQNRTTDTNISIEGNVAAANKAKVDLFIDVHLNAGGGVGCECYHSHVGGVGKTVAVNICSAISALGFSNRGAKVKKNVFGKDYYAVIRTTNMDAVLVECCFIDSNGDMARFNADKMAQAICGGVLKSYPALVKPVPVKPDVPAKPVAPAQPAKPTAPAENTIYRVQVGAFASKANAEKLVAKLKSDGYDATITT